MLFVTILYAMLECRTGSPADSSLKRVITASALTKRQLTTPLIVPVNWVTFLSRGEKEVPLPYLEAFLHIANDQYRRLGLERIQFQLTNYTIVANDKYEYIEREDFDLQDEVYELYGIDNQYTLNVFSTKTIDLPASQEMMDESMTSFLRSWSSFPNDPYSAMFFSSDSFLFSAFSTKRERLNDFMRSFLHESLHWFGLYHVYEGGCHDPNDLTAGDFVADTPPANNATRMPIPGFFNVPYTMTLTKTSFASTCRSGLFDLFDNIMDYTMFASNITPLQRERVLAVADAFRRPQ